MAEIRHLNYFWWEMGMDNRWRSLDGGLWVLMAVSKMAGFRWRISAEDHFRWRKSAI